MAFSSSPRPSPKLALHPFRYPLPPRLPAGPFPWTKPPLHPTKSPRPPQSKEHGLAAGQFVSTPCSRDDQAHFVHGYPPPMRQPQTGSWSPRTGRWATSSSSTRCSCSASPSSSFTWPGPTSLPRTNAARTCGGTLGCGLRVEKICLVLLILLRSVAHPPHSHQKQWLYGRGRRQCHHRLLHRVGVPGGQGRREAGTPAGGGRLGHAKGEGTHGLKWKRPREHRPTDKQKVL